MTTYVRDRGGTHDFEFICPLALRIMVVVKSFMRKRKANIFGCISMINGSYGDANKASERLVPRTEELPLNTTEEFNDKR